MNSNGTVAIIGTQCDGAALLRALEAAAASLAAHVDEVNALNVYPVPDGDTGSNLLHTAQTAVAHARSETGSIDSVAAAAAHGALMGARGNSGVIFSQIVRGLKDALAGRPALAGDDLRAAFAAARGHAFAAVTEPAEGTILTVLAEMARAASAESGDALAVLRAAVAAGAPAVERTREQNPMNSAAGVVDAGARGLWLLLDGALGAFDGRIATAPMALSAPPGPAPRARPAPTTSVGVASWEGAYDVQFLVEHPSRPIDQVREEMLEFGADCVLVVGDETVMKVHVHTQSPDQILRIGLTAGRIADVVVEDLDAMSLEHERATGIVVRPPPRALAVVTIVPGEGFAEVARSLGAVPLHGGATMNPSTEDILEAIRAAHGSRTIVLTNDRNVVLAARKAAEMHDGVTVIATNNLAQGMAALVHFDPERDPAEVISRMEEELPRTHCLEITTAVRTSRVDGIAVVEGQVMALLDGRAIGAGDDELAVLEQAASRLGAAELLTVYVGFGVGEERAASARTRLAAACPGAQVEVLDGGQPHYSFIVQAD